MSVWSALFLLVLVGLVPYLSERSARSVGTEDLSRIAIYANLCVSLWVLVALCVLVIKIDGQTLADVYVTTGSIHALRTFLGWTAALTGGGLLMFALSHLLRHRLRLQAEQKTLSRLRPTRPAEVIWMLLVVSPTAGLCEEFLYRGFVLSRIDALVRSQALAAVLAAAAFGLAHLYQGWLGALRAALIALLLAVPVVAAGTLLPSMAGHALIDAAGILWLWPRLERKWPVGS